MSLIGEARAMMRYIEQAWNRGCRAALLTIANVQGSSYRQPGAKMMVTSDEVMHGNLSGGCLEADLREWAKKAIKDGEPLLKGYNLSDTDVWSLGIGCKGSIEVWITPVNKENCFWKVYQDGINKNKHVSLIAEIPSGAKLLLDENKNTLIRDGDVPEELIEHEHNTSLYHKKTNTIVYEGRQFLIDPINLNEELIISGAGHDAVPVVELAAKVGFDVTVLDPRETFNNMDRFPKASHLVKDPEDTDPTRLAKKWWVIMNHQQLRDEACLKLAVNSQAQYIGVLGPLKRTREMLDNINQNFNDGPIHAPVGHDLAAETIDEVAVSIISELMAVRGKRSGQSLHGKQKIHN
ncbi:XdhC family protein [Salicibibacter cibarius]|uniref:XdhC family protein n=1 Tax=Salicibibacter cibarius TaxID=2743000 RepID=A0A7T6Z0M4_9BACI|nr:XdhC/CoxI family protein [Salicibibacter cibarius]QQK74724.1 XdhC family protein [Salicibibacter cibarius]